MLDVVVHRDLGTTYPGLFEKGAAPDLVPGIGRDPAECRGSLGIQRERAISHSDGAPVAGVGLQRAGAAAFENPAVVVTEHGKVELHTFQIVDQRGEVRCQGVVGIEEQHVLAASLFQADVAGVTGAKRCG